MHRLLLLSLWCVLGLVVGIEGTSVDPNKGRTPSAPTSDVPLPLREVWLRFHEADLCQGLDAVFVFPKTGMEVWARIDNEKSYRKFAELLVPLHASFRINLYATHPVPDKKPTDPPSSLLENAELRGYLRDPYTRVGSPDDSMEVSPRDLTRQAGSPWGDGKPGGAPAMAAPLPAPDLKQRMLAFSEQTLHSARQMKRYADDLPALAYVACDPAEPQKRPSPSHDHMPGTYPEARQVCRLARRQPGSRPAEGRQTGQRGLQFRSRRLRHHTCAGKRDSNLRCR